MKQLVFILAITLYYSCNTQNAITQTNPINNPPFLSKYDKLYDSVVITNISGGYYVGENLYNVLYKNKKGWFWDKYYDRKDLLKKDSIITKKCSTCPDIIKNIIADGALSMLNEKDIREPCKSTHDTIFNNQPVVEIKDLKMHADLAKYNIQIKFGSTGKKLSYLSPVEALEICPQSKERKQFLEIFKRLTIVKEFE